MASGTKFQTDEMREIVDDFLVEATELVASLDVNLVKLESTPEDLNMLSEIFRGAHTLKGTSSFLGYEQITGVTHRMEDILNKLRRSQMAVTPDVVDLLLEANDLLGLLLEHIKSDSSEPVNVDAIMARLVAAAAGQGGDDAPERSQKSAESPTVAKADPGKGGGTVGTPGEQTIRVDVNRLDSLMNLMGELVLSRNSLVQSVGAVSGGSDMAGTAESLTRSSAAVDHITTELQLAVMKMRMQPVSKVFSRFPRLVRDLARDSKKEIDLLVSGETTEVDKSVIEEISDPLVHLLRNACDHGIESPDERRAQGKPGRGVVKLSANQAGSNILIQVEDDGRGLDAEAIRRKAVQRGLLAAADAEAMSDREVFNFVFVAGLSTAGEVSDVSGRGVGMDVVRTNIERLNGLIKLTSRRNIGTIITIKLPLTLAIVQGLLVESDGDVFVVPLWSVYETVRTSESDISYINQQPVLRLRDEIIPIIDLNHVLENNAAGFVMTERPYIVVVGLADRKLGIIIDRFLGQEEVVVKSLGRYLGSTEGIAGATILGDGRVRLIVDLLSMFNMAGRSHQSVQDHE